LLLSRSWPTNHNAQRSNSHLTQSINNGAVTLFTVDSRTPSFRLATSASGESSFISTKGAIAGHNPLILPLDVHLALFHVAKINSLLTHGEINLLFLTLIASQNGIATHNR
jgi:hypothetical protein